jgi:hypothetical protein
MPIPLRTDFDAAQLRAVARQSKHAGQARRLLALAAVYAGATRAEAAQIGGVTRQIVRDWVIKFNAHGPAGSIDRKAPGQPRPAQCHAPHGPGRGDRERADPGDPRRGAMADHRSLPVAVGGVPGQHRQADAEPGAARDAVSQAVGATAPSCPGRRGGRGFKKTSPPSWTQSRAPRALPRPTFSRAASRPCWIMSSCSSAITLP